MTRYQLFQASLFWWRICRYSCICNTGLGVGNTGITGLTIQDDGVTVGNPVNVTSLNFTGAAVTAVGSGAGVTVTVFGGGGPEKDYLH